MGAAVLSWALSHSSDCIGQIRFNSSADTRPSRPISSSREINQIWELHTDQLRVSNLAKKGTVDVFFSPAQMHHNLIIRSRFPVALEFCNVETHTPCFFFCFSFHPVGDAGVCDRVAVRPLLRMEIVCCLQKGQV